MEISCASTPTHLAVGKRHRAGPLLSALLDYVWRYCLGQGYDLAVISGITRQLKLYQHLGFVPFGPLIGTVTFLLLEEGLSRFTHYPCLALGPILLLVALYAHGGIEGLLRDGRNG